MSHQDSKVVFRAGCLIQALRWLLADISWKSITFRDDCSYTPRLAVSVAMLWAWSDELTLVDRFRTARSITQFLFPRQRELATSYQAFVKLLRRWTPSLVTLLQANWRWRMRRDLANRWTIHDWVMFGVDGSRVELPRTRSHEAAYSAARRGGKSRRRAAKQPAKRHAKKRNSPQMWLTTLWHGGTGLPWDWRTGPADSSERDHWLQMLPGLPEGALIAADAGFVGYRCMRAVIDSGHDVLIRVGANVKLIRKLGYVRESSGTVYLWPDQQARKHQPPLVLRLVVVHNGKHSVYLVTNVLSKARMSDRQVPQLYARRWGIEVFYRHFKQTFGRRKLRSSNADNARIEIEWSLVGLWAMALYALHLQGKQGIPPARLSIAQTLRAFRRVLRDYRHPLADQPRLRRLLCEALIDPYTRKNKMSRDYPRKKQESPPGKPIITNATKHQHQQANRLKTKKG